MIGLIGSIGIGLLLGVLATSMYMNPPGSRYPSRDWQEQLEEDRKRRERNDNFERDRAIGTYIHLHMDELVVLDRVLGQDMPNTIHAQARRMAIDKLKEAGHSLGVGIRSLEERLRAAANQEKP